MIGLSDKLLLDSVCLFLRTRFGWTAIQADPKKIKQVLAAVEFVHYSAEILDSDVLKNTSGKGEHDAVVPKD